MNEAAELRLARVQQLITALQSAWPLLREELASLREENILALIVSNNEEMRGRIKQLSDLLELPARLNQEAMHLADEL